MDDPTPAIVAAGPGAVTPPGRGGMAARVRDFDWSRTPLGPAGGWPLSLRTAVGICLNSRFPMMVWWGPELTNIYNDGYAPMLGNRHPDALGRSGRDVWAELWPTIGDQVEAVVSRGESTWNERVHLVMERNGYPEDTWFSWSYSPIPDDHGGIGGLLSTCREDTAEVLGERERDRLADQRRLADERARTILESITDAFFALDREWRFTYANAQAERVLDRSADELLGRTICDAYPGLSGTDFEHAYRRAIDERVATAFTAHYPDHDRWYEVHAYPAADGGVSVYFRDATDQVRAGEAVRQSGEQLRLILASVRDHAIFTLDLDGRVTTWNVGAERMFGYAADEIVGRPGDVLFTPEDRAAQRPEAEMQVSADRGTAEDTRSHVRRDGTRFFASGSMEGLRDDAGDLRGFVKVVRDISERKRAEQAVRESEARFRALATASSDALYSMSADWAEMRQLRSGAFINDTERPSRTWLGDYIHPDDQARVTAAFGQAIATKSIFELEHRVRRADGTLGWTASRAVPLFDAAGEVVEWFGAATDVTDRKRAEADREHLHAVERAALAEAERAGRMKDEFLATLSHELRTPLNAILGWAQIIRGSTDPADVAQGVEVIERNARAQGQIIEDLLDMSRIISGKVRLDVQRLDLSAVTEAAVATARPTADAKGVRLVSVIDPLHGVVVNGDANRLQQVLWNLLANAVKFTPRGGRVEVLLGRVNSHLELSVADTGEGIGPEFLPVVFDRFRQADASTTRRHGGLGLGLSIVKQLVELHGGTVRASSGGPGHGTTFVVSLPLTVVRPEADAAVGPGAERRHPTADPALAGPDQPCVEVAGVRVLVIDDEADARGLVKRLLEDCRAVVTATDSADEVLRLVATGRFDVLVSDIGMPGQDGYALIRRVRALGTGRGGDIPAVALTAYARAEDRVRAISAGFMMHVAKPVERVELVTMVASAAGRTGRA